MNADVFSNNKLNRINSTSYFKLRIPNKRELEQVAINHLFNIDLKHLYKIYKKCTSNFS